MRNVIMIPILLLVYGCNSEPEPITDCGCDSQIIKVLEDVKGKIFYTGSPEDLYIQYKRDDINVTLLKSCVDLPEEHWVMGKEVLISGELKNRCYPINKTNNYIRYTPYKHIKITKISSLTINN